MSRERWQRWTGFDRESLRQHEIAHLLEISQQAVNDSLQRARATVGRELLGKNASGRSTASRLVGREGPGSRRW